MQESVTIAQIVDCPMISVHAGKCYKVLIDSGAALSLLCYSTYQSIKDSFKTHLQPTTAKLNTANGSPKTALGMTALHLWSVEFRFTCKFVICDRLPDTEIIFSIDIQKKFSLSHTWDKEKNCYIQRDGKFLTYMQNFEQKTTIDTVKSSLKIPLFHNGVVPIKITGPVIREQMAYFTTDDNSTKGRHPNINIINDIHKIKGKTFVNIIISNYTNKHITFNKGEYIGCLEITIMDETSIDDSETYSTHSIGPSEDDGWTGATRYFWSTLSQVKTRHSNKIGCTSKGVCQHNLLRMRHPLEPCLWQRWPSTLAILNPSHKGHTLWKWRTTNGLEEEIKKLLAVKVIHSSRSSWSVPIIVVPKGVGGKWLVIDYRALNKVTRKFTCPLPKVEDIFSKLNGAKYFSTLDLRAGYHHIPLDKSSIPKTAFNSPFGKYKYVKVPFGLAQAPAYFQELMTGILNDFDFAIV